jgi:hypothetical protein
MRYDSQQPDLNEMLQEPVVQLVMERDGVSRQELEDLIARVGARYVALPSAASHEE